MSEVVGWFESSPIFVASTSKPRDVDPDLTAEQLVARAKAYVTAHAPDVFDMLFSPPMEMPRSMSAQERRYARIQRLAAEGRQSRVAIARELGVHPQTVAKALAGVEVSS